MAATAGAEPKKIVAESYNTGLSINSKGSTIAFERTSLALPAEVFAANSDGTNAHQLTHHNEPILANLEMNAPETFWFVSGDGVKVQAMVIKPPKFEAGKKYPLLVLLHGGPQTMWSNAWGYRWNAQVFSSAGYVSLMINRRGSTGYGQKFTDEITNDWGGKAYVDVMKGIDAAVVKYNYIDGAKVAAAGGSYGGYMADWIATHTNRFKAIISHAGIYDKAAMYATEELCSVITDMEGTPGPRPKTTNSGHPLPTPPIWVNTRCWPDRRRRARLSCPYTQSPLEFFNIAQMGRFLEFEFLRRFAHLRLERLQKRRQLLLVPDICCGRIER